MVKKHHEPLPTLNSRNSPHDQRSDCWTTAGRLLGENRHFTTARRTGNLRQGYWSFTTKQAAVSGESRSAVFLSPGTWAKERPVPKSSAGGLRQRMRESSSLWLSGGWVDPPRSKLGSNKGPSRPPRSLLRSRERELSTASRAGHGLWAAATGSRPSRRSDRMRSVAPTAGRATSRRFAPEILVTLYVGEHRTDKHQCPVEEKGQACANSVAKCPNCRGPRTAQSNLCPEKKEMYIENRRQEHGYALAIRRSILSLQQVYNCCDRGSHQIRRSNPLS